MSGDNEEQKDKRMDKTRGLLKDVFHFAGNAAGLLSLLIVVFKGGALVSDIQHMNQRQEITDRRIDAMEQGGSAALREHTKMDDERVSDIRMRTQRLEDMLIRFSEVSADVKVLNTKVDSIKEQLSKGKI